MELVNLNHRRDFEQFVVDLLLESQQWYYFEVEFSQNSLEFMSVRRAASILREMFVNHDGRMVISSKRIVYLIVKTDVPLSAQDVTAAIQNATTFYDCKVQIKPVSKSLCNDLFVVLEENESYNNVTVGSSSLLQCRNLRPENVVFIAEDDLYVRKILETALSSGANVRLFEDGTNVVDAYRAYAPDMLLLDIHLPGKGGFTILGEISKLDPNPYIVMLSADSTRENVVNTHVKGAKGFMTKPFNKVRLMEFYNNCPTIFKSE